MQRGRFWLAFATLLACVMFAPAARAQGRWLRVESEHFIVYSDANERNVLEAVQSLEKFDEVLRRLLRPPETDIELNKLDIYLFRSRNAITDLNISGLSSMVRGFYAARVEAVSAYAIFRDTYGLDAQEVLYHEYAHHFMMQYFDNAYPRWFIEGFAEFVSTVDFQSDGRAIIGNPPDGRAAWLMGARWMDTSRVIDSASETFTSDEVALFYAQSWLIAHYILANRTPGFQDYMAALRRGEASLPAFEAAFGRTAQQFHTDLWRYVNDPIPRYGMQMRERSPSELTVTRLPEVYDALMMAEIRTRFDLTDEVKTSLTQQIERGAAAFPDEPLSIRLRAQAAAWRADYAGAREILAPLLADNSTDVPALYLAGQTFMTEAWAAYNSGDMDTARTQALAARRLFGRAFRIDPNHVPTLYRYVDTYRAAQQPFSENVVDVLISAHLHAPQVDEIAINTALALMYVDMFDEAATMLRPVANNPHRDPNDARLAEMLAAAEEHRLPNLGANPDAASKKDAAP